MNKQYKNRAHPALKDLSLHIKEGEIFGVLGPNGAGKTTLFSIVCGIILPTSGQIKIGDYSIANDISELKKIIGVVPQSIALYPTLTGVENLLYFGRMYGVAETLLKKKIAHYIDLFDLQASQHEQLSTYSGGMKRSINLIAGLLHNPRLLLLDEPTVGLDVHARVSIMKQLRRLNQEDNLTILYTSHYLEQAAEFCDRIGVLHEGELLLTGQPNQLLEKFKVTSLEELILTLTAKTN